MINFKGREFCRYNGSNPFAGFIFIRVLYASVLRFDIEIRPIPSWAEKLNK
jgi:hypothetical protein